MSTSIKRVALVAVAALGLGVLAVAPSQAAPSGDTLALSATSASVTSGSAATVNVTQTFLAEAGDTMTVTAALISFPAGNTAQPSWSSKAVVDTDLGTPFVDTATARVAKIGSYVGYINKQLTLSFTGVVAGSYTIRVTPAITSPSNLTPVAGYKDFVVTVAPKTIGWNTAYLNAYSNGTSDTATAATDAVAVSVSASASTTAKARIDWAQGYGSTASTDTASATDAQSVVVTTDKGLVSKTNDYTAAAKSVTLAAATAAKQTFWIFSNGDIGKAAITVTVNGALVSTKNVSFTGVATALVSTISTGEKTYIAPAGTTKFNTTSTDAAGSTVANPTGLTVKSSDTSVATVAITGNDTVTVTGVKAGTVTVTVTDPATTGTATASTFSVTVAPAKSTSAPVISFDKSAYAVGELVTMTISSTMADSATATLFSTALVYSAGNIVWSGTAGTGTTHAVVGGKVTYKFYAPAVSGTFTVTGTTGGDVDLTTAATVTKTVDIINPSADAATDAANEASAAASDATDAALAAADAADAATAAAQDAVDAVAALSAQVNKLISALKAQITTLTNLVIKIQKKVKA